MRISIVQGPFLPVPPLLGGAVEKIMAALAPAWAARGHEVFHVSRRFPGLPDREVAQGVQHVRVASRDAPAGRAAFRLAELAYCLRARRVLPAADILLSNAVLLPLLVRSQRFGQLCIRLGRMPKGQLRFYRHAAWLQALSRAQAEAMRREDPVLADRIAVIGSPLPAGFEPLSAQALGAPRETTFLFVGRLHPEKGVDLLIRAFLAADLPERWRLVLIGPHEIAAGGAGPAYLDSLRRLAAGAGTRIEIRGPLFDQRRLVEALRAASLFVYPSLAARGETFGLSVLEAMSQGCVPLVSALPVFRDLVVPGENGFVFDHAGPAAERSLAEALRTGMADLERLTGLRRAAVAASRSHTVDSVAERYLDEFARLLGQ